MNDLAVGITVTQRNGKPCLIINKKITNIQEIRILSHILLEKQRIMIPLAIEDKLKFYAQLKNKKII